MTETSPNELVSGCSGNRCKCPNSWQLLKLNSAKGSWYLRKILKKCYWWHKMKSGSSSIQQTVTSTGPSYGIIKNYGIPWRASFSLLLDWKVNLTALNSVAIISQIRPQWGNASGSRPGAGEPALNPQSGPKAVRRPPCSPASTFIFCRCWAFSSQLPHTGIEWDGISNCLSWFSSEAPHPQRDSKKQAI